MQIVHQGMELLFQFNGDDVAFVKQGAFAVYDPKYSAYWIDQKLSLDGVDFSYRQWHNVPNNTKLEDYLIDLGVIEPSAQPKPTEEKEDVSTHDVL